MFKSTRKSYFRTNGGIPVMSPTGHFHIKRAIKENDSLLGGEMSGHIFFNDKWYGFDDGHYAGVRVAEILANNSIKVFQNSLMNFLSHFQHLS
jgi:phosphomannomutase/phosphoglucomutase